MVFIRHANAAPLPNASPERAAAPHDWKMADQMRPLTPKGQEQCQIAATWFAQLNLRGVITSPAQRASHTAANMCGFSTSTLALRMVQSVHPAGMNETCESLFETMGYGPLRKFFDKEEGNAAFRDYAGRVCIEMTENIQFACTAEGDCLAVFGHAVFLNAIALILAEAAGGAQETIDSLLDMDLGETQGILLDIETGTITKKTANLAGQGAANLVASCQKNGVAQIVLIRHANAAPLDGQAPTRQDKPHHWKKEDQSRELTAKGVEQCEAAKLWCTALPLRSVIASPAKRAKATAENMTSVTPVIVECVHPAGMSEVCETLFEQMGYGPLCKFFEADGGEEAFRSYGNTVCDELSSSASQAADANGTCMAVFGHAVFLNAIALEILMALPWSGEAANNLFDMDLGETEGILIDLTTGRLDKKTV